MTPEQHAETIMAAARCHLDWVGLEVRNAIIAAVHAAMEDAAQATREAMILKIDDIESPFDEHSECRQNNAFYDGIEAAIHAIDPNWELGV